MVELVVFDMAGTTIDENNVVYRTVHAAILAAGYSVSLEYVLASGAGKEKSKAIRDVLEQAGAQCNDDEIASIFADFKRRLSDAYESLDVKEQPGASALFQHLKQSGIRIALNTGYDRTTADGLLQKLQWTVGDQIDAVITASDVTNGRPAPDMIQLAMARTGVSDPGKVVKIGDSTVDIEEGLRAGCLLSLGITSGAQTREQLLSAKPSQVIDHLGELPDLLTIS